MDEKAHDMTHEYKTHFVGSPGRVFCGIPRGNFPVTVVFETVTCRQCVRRYFARGNVTTGRISERGPQMQTIVPRSPMGREIRKMAELAMGYGVGPQSFLKALSGDPYLELAKAIGLRVDTSPSWPPWLPAQDEEA